MRVHLHDVSVERGSRSSSAAPVRALESATLSLDSSERIAVMGGSGSGKSTLVLAITRLLEPTSGVVSWAGADPSLPRGVLPVSLVLQRAGAALVAESVEDEITAAIELTHQLDPTSRAAVAHAALAEVGLDQSLARRDPLQLSGGEQRRVAVAAALARRPDLLVFDEPSAGLDGEAREALHAALARRAEAGAGYIIVTHDAEEAARTCSRLIILDVGRITFDGSITSVLGDPAAARALGIAAPLHVRIAHDVARAAGLTPPDGVSVGVHADFIAAAAARASSRARLLPTVDVVEREQAAPDRFTVGSDLRPESVLSPRPPRVDPRARMLVFVLAVVATFAAASVAGVVAVVIAAVVAARSAGTTWVELGLVCRPLVLIAAVLTLLQVTLGGDPVVTLVGDVEVESGAAFALLRSLQVLALLVSSHALGAGAAALDLAEGLGFILAPLRLVRVPVDDAALVAGIGIGAATSFVAEIEELDLAQRARGIDPRRLPPRQRLRIRAMLVVPLFVVSLRRSRQLAESLASRGFLRGGRRTQLARSGWRSADTMLVLGAAALTAIVVLLL